MTEGPFPCAVCRGHGYIIETWPAGQDSLFPEIRSGEFICGARFPPIPGPEEPIRGVCYAGCKFDACHRCGGLVMQIPKALCDDCLAAPWPEPVATIPRPERTAHAR